MVAKRKGQSRLSVAHGREDLGRFLARAALLQPEHQPPLRRGGRYALGPAPRLLSHARNSHQSILLNDGIEK